MTEDEIKILGTYNAECTRGLVHTEDWDREMALLQERFDQRTAESYRIGARMPYVVITPRLQWWRRRLFGGTR